MAALLRHINCRNYYYYYYRLFKRLLLRDAPSPVTTKEDELTERYVEFERVGHQQGTQLKRGDQTDGPTP